MAFGVTKWGYSPDPRPPSYGPVGFNFGEIPSYRWVSKTTDAEAPFDVLNVDVIWESVFDSNSFVWWKPLVLIPGFFKQDLQVRGTDQPAGGPPTFTSAWNCTFGPFFGPPVSEGLLKETYQNAIGVRSFIMSGTGTGGPLFPNPLVFTPHKWNAGL